MKIMLIVGSLRKESFNRQLADLAMKDLERHPGVEVYFLDYADLPVFNADHAYPFPETANEIRQAVYEMDALWVFCPEYNGSVPGPLKNLLDYLSLSFVKDNFASGTPVRSKPAAVAGCGGRFGSSRAQAELIPLLERMGCKVMKEPEVKVSLPPQAFTTGKWEPDAQTEDAVKAEADAFVHFIRETLGIHR